MILDRIVATKKEEVKGLLAHQPIEQWADKAGAVDTATRSLVRALAHPKRETGIIAEIKKASPSKGLIRTPFEPAVIARAYQAAGVDAVSVLTDAPYFQGDIDYLRMVKDVVGVPVFRKDFIIHPVQIYQTKLAGADAFLLIAAILTQAELAELIDLGRQLGLETLIEIHNQAEVEKVLPLAPTILGINNRDLRTFETTLETTRRLMAAMPSNLLVVSESGINSAEDVQSVRRTGARAILVGEHLMRQTDLKAAVIGLMGEIR